MHVKEPVFKSAASRFHIQNRRFSRLYDKVFMMVPVIREWDNESN